MLVPTLEGWKVETDRRRHRLDEVRRRRPAVRDQPRGGLLRRRARHGEKTNPNAMATIERNTIFTNCALHRRRRRLVGGHDRASRPAHLIDWQGNDWTPESDDARRAPERPLHHAGGPVPVDRARVGGPQGRADRRVPVRRPPLDACVPLVREAFDWEHGVFLGATMGSETTAAAAGDGRRAAPRPVRDAAVLRLQHGRLLRALARRSASRDGAKLPKIFHVNWFRKDDDGKFLWPGFGENSRVLEWVFRRCDGAAEADETPIGHVPTPEHLDIDGLDIPTTARGAAAVDLDEWQAELDADPRALRRVRRPLPAEIRNAVRRAQGPPELSSLDVSLAEETEAGSTEYRDRLLALVGDARGRDRPRVRGGLRPPAVHRRPGHLGRAPRGEVLGAFEFANERGARAGRGARVQPDARRRRLRAPGLGAGDQHRRLAVPRRLA